MSTNDIRPLARQKVSNRIALTGQQVPAPVVEDAADLLACIWNCGEQKGITITDWRQIVMLEQVTVDVLAISRRGGAPDDD